MGRAERLRRAGARTARDIMDGAYTARGLGGQYITVIPQLDMVIAHKVDPRPAGATARTAPAHFRYAVQHHCSHDHRHALRRSELPLKKNTTGSVEPL